MSNRSSFSIFIFSIRLKIFLLFLLFISDSVTIRDKYVRMFFDYNSPNNTKISSINTLVPFRVRYKLVSLS